MQQQKRNAGDSSPFDFAQGQNDEHGCGRGDLPLAELLQFFDLADDEVALEAAEAVDEEDAVEVVDLVLHGAGEKLFTFDLEPVSVDILRADLDLGGAMDLLANLGEAEATLFFELLALALDDLGIDEDELLFGILLEADVDDGKPLRDAALRCGEAEALRGVHGREHLIDELLELRVEDGDGLARPGQHGVGPLYDFMYLFQCLAHCFAHLIRSNLLAIAVEVSLQFTQRV